MEVDVKKVVIIDAQSLVICTSFGVFTYSTALYSRKVFNPYDLDPSMTPSKIINMIQSKQFSSALSGAISMNFPIKKLLKKIPV